MSLAHKAIRTWSNAVRANEYLIRLTLDHERGGAASPRKYNHSQLTSDNTIAYLRSKNAQGYHIYVRPMDSYIMVDDVSPDRRPEEWAAAIVLTSKRSTQWWIPVGNADPGEVSRAACASLGGDPACTDPGHLGRLPGLTNRKDCHRDENGKYPWVKLMHENEDAVPYPLDKETEAPSLPIPTPPPKGGGIAGNRTQSERDWAYACWLMEQGRLPDQAASELASFRRACTADGKADRDDYVIRTVLKAADHVQRQGLHP